MLRLHIELQVRIIGIGLICYAKSLVGQSERILALTETRSVQAAQTAQRRPLILLPEFSILNLSAYCLP
jgi:hypothetical protein